MTAELLQTGQGDLNWVVTMQERLSESCQGMRVRHRADTIFLLVMGGRILTMQTGFALLESAHGEKMNSANIMMKNTMDLLLGAVAFFFFGYWLAFGDGAEPQLDEENNFDYAMWFQQFSYATTAATIDSGAFSGRISFSAYVIFSMFVTGVIYPSVVRMTWGGGWLGEMGFIDFAGSSIVHMVGASSALVSCALLGPRIGRFPKYEVGSRLWQFIALDRKPARWYRGPIDEVEKAIFVKPRGITNPVQALFGLFVLIIGFLGFNPGSTLATTGDSDLLGARATVTTLLAGSGGALAVIAWSAVKTRIPCWNIPDFVTGILASLVASCACCHVITPAVAMLVGFLAAWIAFLTQECVDRMHIDDPVGAIAVHGPPGAFGTICVAIFAKPHCLSWEKGLVYGGGSAAWELLGIQCFGVLALAGFTMVATYVLVTSLKLVWGFRCERSAELIGLDYVEHSYDDGTYTADQNKIAFLEHTPIKKFSIANIGNPGTWSWTVGHHGQPEAATPATPKASDDQPQRASSSVANGHQDSNPGVNIVAYTPSQNALDEVGELRRSINAMRVEIQALKDVVSRPTQRVNAVQQLRNRESGSEADHSGGLRSLQQLALDLSHGTTTALRSGNSESNMQST
mmetsp:Transcript_45441/g.101965  ORF Transcript_45441/g.101965 Transcript_45441/m.101965 type:complete len:630 (-) Transcript_45441:86-1975(-)